MGESLRRQGSAWTAPAGVLIFRGALDLELNQLVDGMNGLREVARPCAEAAPRAGLCVKTAVTLLVAARNNFVPSTAFC
jgi:hypothetical protein